MGMIDLTELAAIWIGNDLVCYDCIENDELTHAKEDQIVTKTDVQDTEKIYFVIVAKKEYRRKNMGRGQV